MLYPDFNDLIALKNRKFNLVHTSCRPVKSTIPGNHHSPFRGQGMEFDSVREYVFGDDIRNIDWRVTARTGAPHLKLFKEERERHTLLCIDMNSTMRFGTRNTFKSVQAAYAAALLGWHNLAQSNSLSGCLYGDVPGGIQLFAPKRTHNSFCAMLKMMAKPLPDRHQISIKTTVQHINRASHTGSLIYFISDFMELPIELLQEPGLSRLHRRCDLVFIAINDPADSFIPPIGPIEFYCSSSGKACIDTGNSEGRGAYNALWKKNRAALYELTSKFKIPLLELTTQSDISRELLTGLKTLAKRRR